MNDWKCPIECIDEDIREVVRLIFNNNMKPYLSCSGSYKDHKDKPYFPESAFIEMLDSENTRELLAILINDKRFKISISKEGERVVYDNNLPNGLRFEIEFENICGDMQEELIAIIQTIIQGKKAEAEDRKRIDMVCSLIDTFDTIKNQQITFSFNDEMIIEEGEHNDNYSIKYQDKKNFKEYYSTISHAIDGFEQDESGCKIYGSDFLSMLSVLRKIIMDYDQIETVMQGEEVHLVQPNSKRINRFRVNCNEKIETAKVKIEEELNSKLFETRSVDFDDLMSMFEEK